MRAYLPDYELRTPRDLREALKWMAAKPGDWKPFAGGTDLMVLFETGKLAHKRFVNIWDLAELKGIKTDRAHVTIGALTTYSEIRADKTLAKEFPMLCRAAAETGAIAIQNRGTIGGNIANASPAADSPPALLAYDAEVELVSSSGSRWLAYEGFHTGYKTTRMRAEELLARVRLPRKTVGCIHYYRKVGTRKAQAISKVCFAGLARMERGKFSHARIALGSVGPTALRCPATERKLLGMRLDEAVAAVAGRDYCREIAPIDDIRSTGRYRLRVAENLLMEFLAQCGTG